MSVFPTMYLWYLFRFYSQGLALQGMTICMTLHKGWNNHRRNLVLSLWAEISVIILSASSEPFPISNQTTYILSSLAPSLTSQQAKSVITCLFAHHTFLNLPQNTSPQRNVTQTSDTQGSPSPCFFAWHFHFNVQADNPDHSFHLRSVNFITSASETCTTYIEIKLFNNLKC